MENIGHYSELALALMEIDQCDLHGNKLSISEYIGKGLYSTRIKQYDHSLKHYTDESCFESILAGHQIGLKKYCKMYWADTESEEIFRIYLEAIDSLLKEGFIKKEQHGKLIQSYNRMKDNKDTFKHFFMGDINKTLECTPYCFCMTAFDFEETKSPFLLDKDLTIHFDCIQYELDNEIGVKSPYNALQMYRIVYNDDYVLNEIKKYIMHFIRKVSDVDIAIEGIEHVISELRIAIITSSNISERETRLVLFLPNDPQCSAKIEQFLSHKRRRKEDGSFVELKDDSDFVYINFNDFRKQIVITLNKKARDPSHYMKLIEKYGYEGWVSEQKHENHVFDLYNAILGDDICFEKCFTVIRETDFDTVDSETVHRFFKASLSLGFILNNDPTKEQLETLMPYVKTLCEKCIHKEEQCFINFICQVLPHKKLLPDDIKDLIFDIASYSVTRDIYLSYYSGMVEVLFRNDRGMLIESLKRCDKSWFSDHLVSYNTPSGNVVEELSPGYTKLGLDEKLIKIIERIIGQE